MFDLEKIIKINKFTLIIVLFVFLLMVMPYTYSKLFSESSSDSKIETAFFLLETNYYQTDIKIENLIPSDDPYIYKFSISNNDGKDRLETNMEYSFKLTTTTNLPLSYKLYKNDDKTDIIINDNIIRDGTDGAYFRILETEKETLSFDKDITNVYTLEIIFSKDYDSYEFQDVVEGIFLDINAKQIIE